jgi:hypothetical protein
MDLSFTPEQILRVKSMTKEQSKRLMQIMNNDYFKALNESIKIAGMMYPETKKELEKNFLDQLLNQFDIEEEALNKHNLENGLAELFQ